MVESRWKLHEDLPAEQPACLFGIAPIFIERIADEVRSEHDRAQRDATQNRTHRVKFLQGSDMNVQGTDAEDGSGYVAGGLALKGRLT
jgi:hypothetical protein